jgi:hypothetical protein
VAALEGRATPRSRLAEIRHRPSRRSAQEEVMKNLSAFVVVAFSVALPAAFLAQLAAL